MSYESSPAGVYAAASRLAGRILEFLVLDAHQALEGTGLSVARATTGQDLLIDQLLECLAVLPLEGRPVVAKALATLQYPEPPVEPSEGF